MFANLAVLPTLAAAWLLYLAGRRLGGLPMGSSRRTFLVLACALFCLPGASFVLYYTHAIREPAWYGEWRSVAWIETLAAFWGLPCGLVEPGAALREKWPAVRTLLGRRPLLRLALLLAVVPFIKPIVLPVGLGPRFQDAWDQGVCKQSTMATCGPCSLATMFRALGIPRTEEQIARGSYSCATGTENWYLMRYARRNGLKVRLVQSARLPEVKPPAILGVELGEGGAGHFITYLGLEHGRMVVGDPLSGRILLGEGDFRKLYRFTGTAMEFSR